MSFDHMRAAFESYIGLSDDVDTVQLALWFNEAQLDLAYDFGPVMERETGEIPAGYRLKPDDDWLCLLDSSPPCQVQPNGDIVFTKGGSGKLYYRRLPLGLSGVDGGEECELPPALHYLLPIFAAARYWDSESEGEPGESSHASKWLGYYYQGKNQARARLLGVHGEISGWLVR